MYLFRDLKSAHQYFHNEFPEDQEILVIEDEPFLPAGVYSLYEYYLIIMYGQSEETNDIYFPFVPTPSDWEIRGYTLTTVRVWNEGMVRGNIHIRQPYENGYVGSVTWFDEDGKKLQQVYYNRYGFAYKKTYSNEFSADQIESYYTDEGKEWLLLNKSNNTAALFDNGALKGLFHSMEEMQEALLKQIAIHQNIEDRREL